MAVSSHDPRRRTDSPQFLREHPRERRPLRRVPEVEARNILRLRDPERRARIPERLLEGVEIVSRRHRLAPLLRRGVAQREEAGAVAQIRIAVRLPVQREDLGREREAVAFEVAAEILERGNVAEGRRSDLPCVEGHYCPTSSPISASPRGPPPAGVTGGAATGAGAGAASGCAACIASCTIFRFTRKVRSCWAPPAA